MDKDQHSPLSKVNLEYSMDVVSSPAGGENLAVGQTFSGQSYKRVLPLEYLTPPK